MRNCQRWSEGKVIANGVYETEKWRPNSKKQAVAKKMVGTNHPLPETGSSLGRFWAVVLSSEEGLPPAAPTPTPHPEVYALTQISPPTSSARRASSFLGWGGGRELDHDLPIPLGFVGGSKNGVSVP